MFPSRPIVIHAGAQPNNSPHAGTLIVFILAFHIAIGIRQRMEMANEDPSLAVPPVHLDFTFVDTAPVKAETTTIDGVEYQKSYRYVPGALQTHMHDYREVFRLLERWSGITPSITHQSDFFAQPHMPALVRYVVAYRERLGWQLSPKYGRLALRAACPAPGCGLADKHGTRNVYADDKITFSCPHHGDHVVRLDCAADVARLEANAPTRGLLRAMAYVLDTAVHHVRVTGADYAGTYQEEILHRPLGEWAWACGRGARMPHVRYAPLITDWSGAKLSKSLYVKEGGYDAMRVLGTDGLCSFARLRETHGAEAGLRKLWDEVGRWMADPKKLFRSYSVEYLMMVLNTPADDVSEE